jgi:site-specific DNA-methyltransferase (adenine-specific)
MTNIKQNEIYLQDNLSLLSKIDNEIIDLIYCDILYGTGKNFGDYQDLKPVRKEIEDHYIPRFIEMKRTLRRKSGSLFLQMDSRISHWVRVITEDLGFNLVNEIVWEYGLGRSSDRQFGKRHDIILWLCQGDSYTYNKILTPAKSNKMKGQFKNMGDVWSDIPSLNNMANERVGYATQKPIELLERIILAASNENDLVADFYMGSGTAMVVAKKHNRRYIGCDINPKSIEIASKRLEEII